MVAYSFQAQFVAPIVTRTKRQTVRAIRKRNPREGERLQLYVGMRTKACRKIIPDPVCTGWELVRIAVDPAHPAIIAAIRVGAHDLNAVEIERFARFDGFAAAPSGGAPYTARRAMGAFWLQHHGAGMFEGVVIRWEDR